MDRGISEIVGRGRLIGGGSTQVYRALRELLCATCGGVIAEGAMFTRRKVKGIGLRILPRCEACEPFTVQPAKKERSALLRALLTEQPDALRKGNDTQQSGTSTLKDSDEQERGRNLDEEVRRRLGPALKRTRRGAK